MTQYTVTNGEWRELGLTLEQAASTILTEGGRSFSIKEDSNGDLVLDHEYLDQTVYYLKGRASALITGKTKDEIWLEVLSRVPLFKGAPSAQTMGEYIQFLEEEIAGCDPEDQEDLAGLEARLAEARSV